MSVLGFQRPEYLIRGVSVDNGLERVAVIDLRDGGREVPSPGGWPTSHLQGLAEERRPWAPSREIAKGLRDWGVAALDEWQAANLDTTVPRSSEWWAALEDE